jgi:heme A synthase
MDSLRGVHALIGIVGLVLVLVLTVIAVRAKAPNSIKISMIVLLILVFVQVGLGMELLGGADALGMSHEANGILIVLLSLLTGGLTMQNARHQKAT